MPAAPARGRRAPWRLPMTWLRAAHAGPTLAVTAGATALGAATGQPPARLALLAAMVLTGQLSIGWSNDALDWRRDAQRHRTDKPTVAGEVSPRALGVGAGAAAVASVGLSLAYGPLAGALHLVTVASGWAYNLGLKASALSWLPYAAAFGALPAAVAVGAGGPGGPGWYLVAAGALLGVGAHLANAAPDIADDLATGVRGLPHRLGADRSRSLAAACLLAVTALLVLAPPGPAGAAGWATLAAATALLGAARAVSARHPRALFPATMLVALLDVGLLLARGAGSQ